MLLTQYQTLILLLILNTISLIIFGIDKIKSKRKKWRIPELHLLIIAFIAPIGAYTGMLLFRHKTGKLKFILVPIFLFLQIYLALHFRLI